MKKRLKLVLIIAILISCKRTNQGSADFEFCMPGTYIMNDTLLLILDDYAKYVNDSVNVVYQLFLDEEPDSLVCYIRYTQFRHEALRIEPTGFIKFQNNLFLLYSGLNKILICDTINQNRIKQEISRKKLKEKGKMPAILEKHLWSVSYRYNNRKIMINKKSQCYF